jgi:WhiB family redox-sensing transcriptional regulator
VRHNETQEDAVTELTSNMADDMTDSDLTQLFGLPDEASWQERALCAQTDPEAFFPEKGGSTREAKKICTGCEVRGECLEYALQHDERFGIWGGLSERERRRLKRAI